MWIIDRNVIGLIGASVMYVNNRWKRIICQVFTTFPSRWLTTGPVERLTANWCSCNTTAQGGPTSLLRINRIMQCIFVPVD